MLMNSVIALTFLTASSNNGGLNIDVQQEEEKRINNDLNQYDTTLFNKDSKAVNDAIAKQKKERQQQIKNDMFQNQASHSTRLNETKKVLFSKSNLEKTSESDKSPYIQNKQDKIFPYILMSVGAFLTLGFVIFSIHKGRRTKNESARKSNI
ncbi:TPA: type VII secretion protein EssA [Staphylococcus aureus]|nr:type VII secretion protein EssA [Staphylococcus aureus]